MPLDTKQNATLTPKQSAFSTFAHAWLPNMVVKVNLTATVIAGITTPLSVMMTRSQMGFGPVGMLGGALYKGLRTNIITGQQRGALSITAKSASSHGTETDVYSETETRGNAAPLSSSGAQGTEHESEFVEPSTTSRFFTYSQPLVFAQMDLAISQVYSNRTRLVWADVIKPESPFKMNLYNAKELFKMAYGARTVSGAMNFTAICFLSDHLSQKFHFKNQVVNDLLGGALSGAVASVATHLPNTVADDMINKTRMDSQGQLTRMTHSMFFKSRAKYIHEAGFKDAISHMLMRTSVELPLRTLNTLIIFAIIQAANRYLGETPLAILCPEDVAQSGPK